MRLWGVLYLAIWVVLLEFLLAMIPEGQSVLVYFHAALGFLIVLLAYYNRTALRQTTAPGRIKRIAAATFSLSIVLAVLGPLIFFNLGSGWPILFGLTFWNGLVLLHVVTAFAVITQMASTATAYDMWEEKEFLKETQPGEVPPPPTAASPKATT
jgi:hypothetical protein